MRKMQNLSDIIANQISYDHRLPTNWPYPLAFPYKQHVNLSTSYSAYNSTEVYGLFVLTETGFPTGVLGDKVDGAAAKNIITIADPAYPADQAILDIKQPLTDANYGAHHKHGRKIYRLEDGARLDWLEGSTKHSTLLSLTFTFRESELVDW